MSSSSFLATSSQHSTCAAVGASQAGMRSRRRERPSIVSLRTAAFSLRNPCSEQRQTRCQVSVVRAGSGATSCTV
eukprot:563253-Rhodomonas_salina.1